MSANVALQIHPVRFARHERVSKIAVPASANKVSCLKAHKIFLEALLPIERRAFVRRLYRFVSGDKFRPWTWIAWFGFAGLRNVSSDSSMINMLNKATSLAFASLTVAGFYRLCGSVLWCQSYRPTLQFTVRLGAIAIGIFRKSKRRVYGFITYGEIYFRDGCIWEFEKRNWLHCNDLLREILKVLFCGPFEYKRV